MFLVSGVVKIQIPVLWHELILIQKIWGNQVWFFCWWSSRQGKFSMVWGFIANIFAQLLLCTSYDISAEGEKECKHLFFITQFQAYNLIRIGKCFYMINFPVTTWWFWALEFSTTSKVYKLRRGLIIWIVLYSLIFITVSNITTLHSVHLTHVTNPTENKGTEFPLILAWKWYTDFKSMTPDLKDKAFKGTEVAWNQFWSLPQTS